MAKSWCSTDGARRLAVMTVCSVMLMALSPSAWTAEHRAWTGDFLRMGAGAAPLAMGNAYTAVEGDVYSAYYNPAGLAYLEDRQFAITHRYLSMDRHFTHAVFGTRIGPDADFGFSWIGAGTDGIEGRDLNGNRTGNIEDSRNSFGVTFSRIIGPKLSAGINAKLSLWKLGTEDAKAVGFDAGVLFRPREDLNLALVVRDVGSRFAWSSDLWSSIFSGSDGQPLEKEDDFPFYWTTGAAWRPLGETLLLTFGTESVEGNPLGYDLGAAWKYNGVFTLRGGINNWNSSDGFDYGSFGGGFGLQVTGTLRLDYAYITDMAENDRTHVISLNLGNGE